MRTIEVIATSTEKAIEKGLLMLETDMNHVEVKVIEEGSMLKKAKIEMTMFDNQDEHEAYLNNNKKLEKQKNIREELPYDAEQTKEVIALTQEYMDGFLKANGEEYNLSVEEKDRDVYAYITGENMGGLIGHHGESMDAIQLLLNTYIREKMPKYERRVYIDIENYRAKRESTLVDMAKRLAEKVVRNRRSMKLEPMNRYERRVIHNALSNTPHIDTHSEGTDPDRYLVIDYIG